MTERFLIERDRSVLFGDECSASTHGLHRVIRLFNQVPYLGCLYCRKRNEVFVPAGQTLFHLLLSAGVVLDEAVAQSGWKPADYERRKATGRRQREQSLQTALTGALATEKAPITALAIST